MTRTALALACLLPLLTGCFSTSYSTGRASRGVELGQRVDPEGARLSWRLYPGVDHRPRIDRTEVFVEQRARVGLVVGPVSRERAEAAAVTPFEGVWVTEVVPESPAARAGIAVGDIVLAVGGTRMASREQFEDHVKQHARIGEELEFELRVFRRPGESLAPSSARVAVVPDAREVRQTRTDSIALESSRGIQAVSGLQLAELTPELSRELFDVEQPLVLVAAVGTGTPAYYAGLRAGDRVTSCDGVPVTSLDVVRGAVAKRVAARGMKSPRFDLAGHVDGGSGDLPEAVALEVEGALGRHSAAMELDEDLEGDTHFYVPILVDYRSDLTKTDMSFLDFIFQFGFNYESRVRPSATREPNESWELSLFPLGMFEIYRSPSRSEYTLFWLIDWESN